MPLTKVGSGVIQDDAVGIANLGATGTASATTFLRGDNAWASAAAGLNSAQFFTSTGTWTKPTGITKVIIEVQGAGGSGNREDSTDNNNSAGGGGGYAKKFLDVSSITTSVITIGDGGAGQASNATAGNSGGASSWNDSAGGGSLTITANGGTGGSTSSLAPSEGGTATNGDINIQGGVGSYNIQGHPAGGSILGNAGVSMQSTALTNGRGYGAGGGSGRLATSGPGAPGIEIVWEYK